jgi:hypothetical protein
LSLYNTIEVSFEAFRVGPSLKSNSHCNQGEDLPWIPEETAHRGRIRIPPLSLNGPTEKYGCITPRKIKAHARGHELFGHIHPFFSKSKELAAILKCAVIRGDMLTKK